MEVLNTLVLVRRVRPGGGGRTERSYLDFLIDGHSLLDVLGPLAGDTCGCLGWGDPAAQASAVRRLQLDDERQIAGEREPIFVCAECGDLGCGAVTARITASKGVVQWTDFAFENGWDPAAREPIADAGPFLFELRAYRRALGEAAAS
ncbi:MAG: hypothetical protein ACTHN0_04120 [Aquihabitans sp.]